MRTPKELKDEIEEASNNNRLITLIKLHDDMLLMDIGIVEKTMKLVHTDFILYTVFSEASKMSKKEPNGVFNRIIKEAIKRDTVLD